MEASNKNTFSHRKFVSIGLFMTVTILIVTAIVIQIFEAIKDDLFEHIFFVIHIFTGATFTILSTIHANMNWESIKKYIKNTESTISMETIYAIILTIIPIIIGILFVLFVMY